MIYAGKEIVSPADKLVKVPLDYVYNSLKNPRPEMVSRIRQLRIAYNVDRKRYSQLKRSLPYLVCGVFNPPFRRNENFACIEYFILDIDHISEKDLTITDLRKRIEADSRVLLSFISPSEDGLKLLFRLKEKCYDSGIYSLFYKAFAREFSKTFSIEQVVDSKTSDVSRACFMSHDENAYYNPDAESIDINAYLTMDDTSGLFELKRELEKINNPDSTQASSPITVTQNERDTDPSFDEIIKIKEILKLKNAGHSKPPVYVPQQLDEIMDDVKKYVEDTGIQIYEITNISYAKKVKMKLGMKMAEINIFFGKKGFTTTISPRTGTNAELNELCRDLISSYLSSLC